MLGNDFLDAWGVVIDFQSLTLYLRPPLAPMWPLLAGVWQVTSWQEEGEARKLDPKAPPKFTFADRRLKVVMDGQTREYAIRFKPDDRGDMILMIDPKQDGKPFTEADIQGGGLIKVKDGRMTLCALSQSGQARDLPEAFAAPKGSGYALIELKRTTPGPDKPSADLLHELLVKEGYKPVRLDREPDGNRMVAARIGKDDLRLMLRTGQTTSVFDTAGLDKWGAVRLGWMKVDGLGDNVSAETLRLRGMTLGEYDTRQVWAVLNGHAINIAGLNVLLARQKRKPIQGMLGNYDLLNGSAVIDYVTNTLYLRPVKKAVEPLLKGKWVGVAWEFDGNKGKYAPGDANVEFKNGRIRFATKNGAAESTFHVRDMGDRYMLGLFEPGANELADGFTYTSTGALRLTDGKLTLVMQKGPLRKEPISFAATKGSGLLLVEYERAK